MKRITNENIIFIILMSLTILMGIIDNIWYDRALVLTVIIWWVFFCFSKKYQDWQLRKFNWRDYGKRKI